MIEVIEQTIDRAKLDHDLIVPITVRIFTKVPIYDSGTTRMVWIRIVFVWKVFGIIEVKAMSCKDELLSAAEMFCEDS